MSAWDGIVDLSIERIRGDAEDIIAAAQGLRLVWLQRPITTDPETAMWMNLLFSALDALEQKL